MIGSKNCLILSLLLVILAIGGIMIGGSIAFTISCLLFIASGATYHKSIMEADIESFEQRITSGGFEFDEGAGEVAETVINLAELSESDKEVLQRVMGITFETSVEETKND